MTTLMQLETPSLVLDSMRMTRNIDRLRARMVTLGVAFRPHLKTAKSIDVAHRVMTRRDGPITVSTLKEADYFAGHGVRDILYAVAIAPNKIAHAAQLMRDGVDLRVTLDSVAAAQALVAGADAVNTRFKVLIEIDCDGHRSGVKLEAPGLLDIAATLAQGGQIVDGVMTHAGSSYNCVSTVAIAAMAEQERAAAVHCAERLRAAGHLAPTVSVGSTPTASFAQSLAGVSEVRAGVFMFFDLVMAGLDVCKRDDIALSVLTTVIGHQPDKGWIITDAGWMALSRDRGTAKQTIDQGYGVVCDQHGQEIDGLLMIDANQEHGIVARRDHLAMNKLGAPDLARYPIGTLLRILPNHACATGAQHDRYHVVEGGDTVRATWARMSGW